MNQTTQMIIMGLVFVGLVAGIHYYIWMRMIRDIGLPSPWLQMITGLLIVLGTSIPVSLFMARFFPFNVSRIVTFVPYTWMGVMMLFFFALVSVDLVKVVVFAIKKIGIDQDVTVDESRRLALGQIIAGSTALVIAGMTGAGVAKAAQRATVRKVAVSLKRLPQKLSGLKVVQISDLHIGVTVGQKWLEDIVKRINVLKPDIVAITGDLTDGDPEMLRDEIAPLKDLIAPHGIYFVTGNHEYYSNANRWIAEIEKLGIRVLRNESVSIQKDSESFFLAGVDDYISAKFQPGHGQNISKAVENLDDSKAVVLLAHQPRAVEEASDMGVDLVLAGHTHGGQIWPFTHLVGLQQPYNKGLYRHSDKTQIYVNQGTFMWGPPMRLGTECEITEITLRSTHMMAS